MSLAPWYLVAVDLTPTHFSDVSKSLGEGTIHKTEESTLRNCADSGLHHPGPGRCGYKYRTPGLEHITKANLKPGKQILELDAPVRNHRLEHRTENFLSNLGGTWEEEGPEISSRLHDPT